MEPAYPHLFSPVSIGSVTLNNGKTAHTSLPGHLKSRGVRLLTCCRVVKIDEKGVSCKQKDSDMLYLPADTVVLAVGDVPDASLYESLQNDGFELYNGGVIIPNAVYEGYTAGCRI